MKKYFLFGSSDSTLDEAHKLVEETVGLKFELRHSSYIGNYSLLSLKNGNIKLQSNFLEEDGELMEESHPNIKALLYVTADEGDEVVTSLVAKICAAVPSFRLLREQ